MYFCELGGYVTIGLDEVISATGAAVPVTNGAAVEMITELGDVVEVTIGGDVAAAVGNAIGVPPPLFPPEPEGALLTQPVTFARHT